MSVEKWAASQSSVPPASYTHCRVCGRPVEVLDAVDGVHGGPECQARVQRWARENGLYAEAWPTYDERGEKWTVTVDAYVEAHPPVRQAAP